MPDHGTPLIAVLGAGGAVGGSVARTVAGLGLGRIRLGVRRRDALPPLTARPGEGVEAVVVDATSVESLYHFCSGCQVVVNCAGAHAAVADATLATGGHYVDPGADGVLAARLDGAWTAAARTAVVGAGVLPGLSTLVPRRLAALGLRPPLALTAYMGTRDRMTLASAAEFLHSLAGGDGEAHAMWRAGARISRALEPLRGVSLPFFAGETVAYPYLSGEAERLARRLPADEVRWYLVFEGERVLAALSRLAEQIRQGAPPAALADELVRVVDVDMFGRTPVQQLVFQLEGRTADGPATRVAVLRASSTYELTATVTALTVKETLGGALPAGAHLAGEVLDPGLLDALDGRPGLAGLHVLDRSLPAYAPTIQGTI